VSFEAVAGFAAAGVGLAGIAVTLYVRWSSRKVRVHVEVREAWFPDPGPPIEWAGSPEPPRRPDVFEATVVAINRGERSVYVEVLGAISTTGDVGFEDRCELNVREIRPGEHTALVVDERMAGFDMRAGFRGYAELATGETVWSESVGPFAPPGQ